MLPSAMPPSAMLPSVMLPSVVPLLLLSGSKVLSS